MSEEQIENYQKELEELMAELEEKAAICDRKAVALREITEKLGMITRGQKDGT